MTKDLGDSNKILEEQIVSLHSLTLSSQCPIACPKIVFQYWITSFVYYLKSVYIQFAIEVMFSMTFNISKNSWSWRQTFGTWFRVIPWQQLSHNCVWVPPSTFTLSVMKHGMMFLLEMGVTLLLAINVQNNHIREHVESSVFARGWWKLVL